MEGYPPLPTETRRSILDGDWTFPADLPLAELEERFAERLQTELDLADVTVRIDEQRACDGGRRAADGSALEAGSGREACGVGIGTRADRDRIARGDVVRVVTPRPTLREPCSPPDRAESRKKGAAVAPAPASAASDEPEPDDDLRTDGGEETVASLPAATAPTTTGGEGAGDGCRRPLGGRRRSCAPTGARWCCRGELAASTSSRRCYGGGPASGSGRSRSSPVGRWTGTLSARPRSARRTTWLSSRRATNRGRSRPAGRSRCRRATICSSSGVATRSTASWRWPRDSRPRRNGWCRRGRGRCPPCHRRRRRRLCAAAAGGGHPRHVRRPRRPRRGGVRRWPTAGTFARRSPKG